MKKEHILILAALVLSLGGWYAVSSGLVNPKAPVREPGSQSSGSGGYFWADQAKWKVLDAGLKYDQATGKSVKFHVEYPRDFNLSFDQAGGFTNLANPSLGKFSLVFPQDAFAVPPTNFGVGNFTVAATDQGTDKCFDPLEGDVKFDRTERIGDLDFKVATAVQGAAGTQYTNEIYRALTRGICLEVDLIVGMANIGNFEPGAVTELDKEKPLSVLRQILHTIRITEEQM